MTKFDSLPGEVRKRARADQNTITINVLAASIMITDAIIEYKSTHEDVEFRLLQSQTDDSYDIKVETQMVSQLTQAKNVSQFIYGEQIFIAVPNNRKFQKLEKIALQDLDDEDFICLMGSKTFRSICDKYCRHVGLTPHIAFESDSPDTVRNMIGASLGIGFWPEFSWGDTQHEKVKLLPISDVNCTRDIIVTCDKTREEKPVAEDFYHFLNKYFATRARH